MKFRKLRIFDKSGKNNLTRDISIRLCGSIICDMNRKSRFHARRNHPRILQYPHYLHYTIYPNRDSSISLNVRE